MSAESSFDKGTRRGVLLLNLGSPRTPDKTDVKRYLTEFLMDPYVIDSPWLIRKILVSGLIVPFRANNTSHAYQTIWRTDEPGSPLLWHSHMLKTALKEQVPFPVELAMRYGSPSISSGLTSLLEQNITEVLLLPLYPHHATSTRTTSIKAVQQQLNQIDSSVQCRVIPPFYNDSSYINALAAQCRPALSDALDLLLFSYHGLPERQITRADPTGQHCLQQPDCCERPSIAHATCYRHQVFETSRLVAGALGLEPEHYQISFQSRLGRLPWLTPNTEDVLHQLPEQGIKRIAVTCPAFVADNLETLEEIDIRGRETFMQAGGESFTLLPCLNSSQSFVKALADWCLEPPPQTDFDSCVL